MESDLEQRGAKVRDLEELARVVSPLKAGGKKIVLCHGVFDLLHIGHIRHFEQAKKFGDVLVVTITPDRYVNKGTHRPAFTELLRAEAVAALDCVDHVAINGWPTAVETIKLVKPNVYTKGSEYQNPNSDLTGKIVDEEEAVRSVGGMIAYTDDIVFSSSTIINKYLPVLSDEVREYLSGFSARHSSDDIIRYLQNASTLSVLVVGETIVDEYHYCEMMGSSAKEPILAVRYKSAEKFAGGTLAVANHLANFCDSVGLLTVLGSRDSQEDFVRQSTNGKIDKMFLYKKDSPTIVKRRFVDSYLMQKMFEVYEMNDEGLDPTQSDDLCAMLEEALPRYDVVIVTDYGHGMLTPDAVELLCSKARFLAVNTQSNAGNRGLNVISKYRRADYVSLAGHEILLEERNRRGDFRDMLLNVSENLDCGRVIVTRGRDGIACYNREEGFVDVPAFAGQVVDRMGAGDAVLALTALCVAQGAPMEIVGFIGNVVGAEAVAMVGHRSSIECVPLLKHVESLLK